MPAGHRTAGDGDEQEREQAAGPDRPAAVHEAGNRGHLQIGTHDDDGDREHQDGADLQEGGQVVARCQQQPDRQHRGDEAVADDDQRQRGAGQVEPRRQFRRLGDGLAIDQRPQQQRGAEQRHLTDARRTDEAAVDAHDQRDRDGAEHGEGPPRAALQCVHHHQRQHGKNDDADQQDANTGDGAGDRPKLGADHVAERFAVPSRGQEQHGHVLHRTGEHHAGEDPQCAGQVAHLRREHRTNQRSCSGNGREMVAEQHVAVGRHVIQAVVMAVGRGRTLHIDAEHLVGDEQRVEPVGDEIDAHRGDDQPGGVDRLPTGECDDAERNRAQHGDGCPEQFGLERHDVSLPRYHAVAGDGILGGGSNGQDDGMSRRSRTAERFSIRYDAGRLRLVP